MVLELLVPQATPQHHVVGEVTLEGSHLEAAHPGQFNKPDQDLQADLCVFFLISCLIEVFLLGPMAVLLAVVLSKALAAQQGRFQLLQKHVLAS